MNTDLVPQTYNATSTQFSNNSTEIASLIYEANSMQGAFSKDKRLDCYKKAFQLLCNAAIENTHNPYNLIRVIEPHLVRVLYAVLEFCDSNNGKDKLRDCASLMELSFMLQCRYFGFDSHEIITSWQYASTLEDLVNQLNADTFGRSLDIKLLCDKFSPTILKNRFDKLPGKRQMFLDTLKMLYPYYLSMPPQVSIAKQFIKLHSELSNS